MAPALRAGLALPIVVITLVALASTWLLLALRAVLQRWIHRGAAWGGPILGWMRDLRHRLEDGGGP